MVNLDIADVIRQTIAQASPRRCVQEMPDVTVGGADVGSRCGVCIEDFEMGERGVIKLACSHLLHRECLQQWVNRDNRSCPICRQDVAGVLQEESRTL